MVGYNWPFALQLATRGTFSNLAGAAGERRPVLIVSADNYNRSRLATVLAAVVTSNTALAGMSGNVFLPAAATGLSRDSVVNITGVVTIGKDDLTDRIGSVPASMMQEVDRGLRRILDL